jgi:hypothetical protein
MKASLPSLASLLVTCVLSTNAVPKHSEELKVVKAGDIVTFNIKLDPAPDFSGGRVAVLICSLYDYAEFLNAGMVSSAPQLSRVSSTDMIPRQDQYTLSVQIPGETPDGEWQAFFSYSLQNGNYRELHHAHTAFRVQGRTFPQAPRYATEIAVQGQIASGR